ncbi:MAG TPA: PAS domain-containing protein, partial [Flavipsychrobacter sp.]
IYDVDTLNILDVNSAATEDYGYSIEEFRKMSVLDLCPQREFKDRLQAVNGNDKVVRIGTFNHTNKDGSTRVLDIMGHKVVFNNKTSILLLANDITERLEALRQLEDNQKKLSAAQKIAKIGYWQLNPSDNKLFWSDEVYTIWGVNKESYVPDYDSYVATIHYDDLPEFKTKAAALTEEGELFDFQHRIIRPDGTIRWVHEKGQGKKDDAGKLYMLEGTVQDITEQKLAALALEEISQRYQYVTKATFDAVWDWDVVNDIIIWGEGFSEIFGYKLNELKKDISSWTDHIHPEDRVWVIQSIDNFIKSNNKIWHEEYKFLKADGSYAFVEDRGFAVRDSKGSVLRMVGAMQDITQRHNYTEAIEQQNEKLREIAWIQSHEVRAPLASIMGLVMLIKDGTISKESESAEKVLDDIIKSAADLDTVIRKISEKTNTSA